jgi:hypothetical protein
MKDSDRFIRISLIGKVIEETFIAALPLLASSVSLEQIKHTPFLPSDGSSPMREHIRHTVASFRFADLCLSCLVVAQSKVEGWCHAGHAG